MIVLLIISIVCGLVYLGIGQLAYHSPDMIAGNHKLSKEELQSDRIKKFGRYIRDVSAAACITTVLGSVVAYFLNNYFLLVLFVLVPPFLMVILILLKEEQNKRRNKYLIPLLSLLCLVIIFWIYSTDYRGNKDIEATISNNMLYIKGGLYKKEILVDDMVNAELIYHIPQIDRKISGYAVGEKQQGKFGSDSLGYLYLYLDRSYPPPFILIEDKWENRYIFNLKDSTKTKTLFRQLITIGH